MIGLAQMMLRKAERATNHEFNGIWPARVCRFNPCPLCIAYFRLVDACPLRIPG